MSALFKSIVKLTKSMDIRMFGLLYPPDIYTSVQIHQTDGQPREDKRTVYSIDIKEGMDFNEIDYAYFTDIYPSVQIHQPDGRPLINKRTGSSVRPMPCLKEGTDVGMFEFDCVYQTDIYPSVQIHQPAARPLGSIRSLL